MRIAEWSAALRPVTEGNRAQNAAFPGIAVQGAQRIGNTVTEAILPAEEPLAEREEDNFCAARKLVRFYAARNLRFST